MTENLRDQFARLPELLSAHVYLSTVALGLGLAISIPLSIFIAERARVRGVALASVGVIQTIPSLALLALMVPLIAGIAASAAVFGIGGISPFGFLPAVVGLTLYSMLPIVRNTVTGLRGVDADLIEAARGLGMTDGQIMRRIRIPLALPVIIAGVRTSTIWVVGIATLSTPVGQPSLGDYIFGGLQMRNWTAVLFGCVAAAVVAIGLDLLIALLESAVSKRNRLRAAAALVGLALVVSIGVGPRLENLIRGDRDARPAIIVGSKTFTEQFILAELITTIAEDAGFRATHRQSLGSTIVFDALRTGEIDVYVDYSGTIWTTIMDRDEIESPEQVLNEVTEFLRDRHEITVLGQLGFENTYALAMRREHAEELGIRTIEDLASRAPQFSVAGTYEFFERPEWSRVRDLYGLDFSRAVGFDATLMYEAIARGEVEVIAAFSTDGRIAAYDLLILDDPRRAFPPYEAVLLLSADAARDDRLVEALRTLLHGIDDELMREANRMVDVDRRSIGEAARMLRDGLR